MAILTIHHYLDIIDSFVQNVTNSTKTYYLFVGGAKPWTYNGVENDSQVLVANDSVYQHESAIYTDISFGKQITNNDIAYLIPRYDWANNTAYDRYDQLDGNLYSKRFYIVTDNYEVYKCIDNNNGANSTIKPSLTTPYGTFSTSDGYTWKFMYSIDYNANSKFTSASYIPVTPNTVVQNNAIGGTIDVIRLNNGGINYQSHYSGYLAGSISNYSVAIDDGANPLKDYYTGSSMYLKAGFGAGQVRYIDSYDGINRLVHLKFPFDTYITFNLDKASISGAFDVGDIVTQNIDNIAISYSVGIFQVGDNIVQSDSGANGTIVTSNSSMVHVVRNSSTSTFNLNTPIYNTSQAGTSKPGNVRTIIGNNWVIANGSTQFTDTANGYAVGGYIRVGSSANNNIRRITAVNSTVVVCGSAFSNTLVSNVHYSMPYVFEPLSISLASGNGIISNTNLNGVSLSYANVNILGLDYILGEKVDMVDINNVNQTVSGIVSFANTSTLILTAVTGTGFLPNFYVKGESSLQRAKITAKNDYPNITIKAPLGLFTAGQLITSRDAANSQITYGTSNVISYYTTPNQLTEYIISPTVNITGDGTGALAYSIVNTEINSTNNISKIVMINPGYGYTYANVDVTANSIYGTGANTIATISPILGHGYDTHAELGARYAGITMNIDTAQNESFKFPVYGKYRKIGIIEDPLFSDATIVLNYFDRAKLKLTNKNANTFVVGEIVYQPNTMAAGIVVYANSTFLELQNVRGTFSANGKYANGSTSNDNIYAMTSITTANVSMANVSVFKSSTTTNTYLEIVSEVRTGATATYLGSSNETSFDPTSIKLTGIKGKFDANDIIIDSVSNTYANVGSIYSSNGLFDTTSIFGDKFNQYLRLPLTGKTGSFQQFEYINQTVSAENESVTAYGRVVSANTDIDLLVNAPISGSFITGNYLIGQTSGANAYITTANSTYLRLTGVTGTYITGENVINNIGVTTTIANVYPVLILDDVNSDTQFASGTQSANVVGQTSGVNGRNDFGGTSRITNIIYPDLVRDSGAVIYLENLAPFQLSNTSHETIKLVIKF